MQRNVSSVFLQDCDAKVAIYFQSARVSGKKFTKFYGWELGQSLFEDLGVVVGVVAGTVDEGHRWF